MHLEKIEGGYAFYCPACKCSHMVNCRWNVDLKTDTLSPSVLVKSINDSSEWETDEKGDYIFVDGFAKGAKRTVCHSFVKNGTIQYLSDCTHDLAGKTVPMEKI